MLPLWGELAAKLTEGGLDRRLRLQRLAQLPLQELSARIARDGLVQEPDIARDLVLGAYPRQVLAKRFGSQGFSRPQDDGGAYLAPQILVMILAGFAA